VRAIDLGGTVLRLISATVTVLVALSLVGCGHSDDTDQALSLLVRQIANGAKHYDVEHAVELVGALHDGLDNDVVKESICFIAQNTTYDPSTGETNEPSNKDVLDDVEEHFGPLSNVHYAEFEELTRAAADADAGDLAQAIFDLHCAT
jgi:hypothetical protein